MEHLDNRWCCLMSRILAIDTTLISSPFSRMRHIAFKYISICSESAVSRYSLSKPSVLTSAIFTFILRDTIQLVYCTLLILLWIVCKSIWVRGLHYFHEKLVTNIYNIIISNFRLQDQQSLKRVLFSN